MCPAVTENRVRLSTTPKTNRAQFRKHHVWTRFLVPLNIHHSLGYNSGCHLEKPLSCSLWEILIVNLFILANPVFWTLQGNTFVNQRGRHSGESIRMPPRRQKHLRDIYRSSLFALYLSYFNFSTKKKNLIQPGREPKSIEISIKIYYAQ